MVTEGISGIRERDRHRRVYRLTFVSTIASWIATFLSWVAATVIWREPYSGQLTVLGILLAILGACCCGLTYWVRELHWHLPEVGDDGKG